MPHDAYRCSRSFVRSMLAALAAGMLLATPSPLHAGPRPETIFALESAEGRLLQDGLTPDGAGGFFGAYAEGGRYGKGAVFGLRPKGGGGWTEKVLHDFRGGEDGDFPRGELALHDGALYGVTRLGGPAELGTVYRLDPPPGGGGAWKHTVLHGFRGADGRNPNPGLVVDNDGVVIGTTRRGGKPDWGVVYELTPPAVDGDPWVHSIVHAFTNADGDGAEPLAGLVADAEGTLYGTTYGGGSNRSCRRFYCGTIFAVRQREARRIYRTICSTKFQIFLGMRHRLAIGPGGILVGVTTFGNSTGPTVFTLDPKNLPDSAGCLPTIVQKIKALDFPDTPLTVVGDVLYGTTIRGGHGHGGEGTIYRLTPRPEGDWPIETVYEFRGKDGAAPGELVFFDGALYGTAEVTRPRSISGIVFRLGL